MNKYKALIRYEAKALIGMLLYFLLAFMLMAYAVYERCHSEYTDFFWRGLGEFRYVDCHITGILTEASYMMIMLGVLGVIGMVLLQFRDSKSVEVGRFMKALPIQNKKVYKIKVICGMVTYTIPYLLYVVVIFAVRAHFGDFVKELYGFTDGSIVQQIVDSVPYVGMILFANYLIISFSYLFLMLMQYLISQPIVSAVIAGLIAFAPLYLFGGLYMLADHYITGKVMREKMYELNPVFIFPWAYTSDISGFDMSSNIDNNVDGWIRYINNIELKVGILLVLCIGVLVLGYIASKHFNVEHADELVSMPIMRTILKIGITVCTAIIPVFLMEIFFYDETISLGIMTLMMIVAALIGFVVSRIIVNIGTGIERR